MPEPSKTFEYLSEFIYRSFMQGWRVFGLASVLFGASLVGLFALYQNDDGSSFFHGFLAGLMIPVGMLIGSFFIFRDTRRELDALKVVPLPLRVTPDEDGAFRRLRVENPNSVSVHSASVSVVSYVDSDGNDLTELGPVRRHRFPWQTQARDFTSKFAGIAAHDYEFADILMLQTEPDGRFPGGVFYFLDIGPDLTVKPFSLTLSGRYEMVVEVTALEPSIPAAIYALHITFENNSRLEMTTELLDPPLVPIVKGSP